MFCRDKFGMGGVNPMFDSRLGSFFSSSFDKCVDDSFPLIIISFFQGYLFSVSSIEWFGKRSGFNHQCFVAIRISSEWERLIRCSTRV